MLIMDSVNWSGEVRPSVSELQTTKSVESIFGAFNW